MEKITTFIPDAFVKQSSCVHSWETRGYSDATRMWSWFCPTCEAKTEDRQKPRPVGGDIHIVVRF